MPFKEAISKVKEYAGTITAIAGALGIMYGVVTFLHNREEKITNAVTKQEVEQIVSQVSLKTDSVSAQNIYIMNQQAMSDYKIDILSKNVLTVRDELVRQIRMDKSITEAQKIDDILRIVEGIKADLVNQEDSLQPKIKVRKIK